MNNLFIFLTVKQNVFSKLSEYFSFSFVRYAFIVAILISLCSALLGVSLVLKRYSMIGDGLSHVAFGAGAVSAVVGVAGMTLTLPVTVVTAIFLLKSGGRKKIMGDAAIAMLSAGALAMGYLLLNITNTSSSNLSGDVCTSLFGSTSILTLSRSDVNLCFVLCAAVILFFVLCYNRMFSLTFDERFAGATGINVGLYNLLTAIITATVIVVGMKLAGALLISALIIFPPMAAMRICKSYRSVILTSALISVFCAFTGLILAVLYETPVGASIVCVNLCALIFFSLLGFLKKKIRNTEI